MGNESRPLLPHGNLRDLPVGKYVATDNPANWEIPTVSWLSFVDIEEINHMDNRDIRKITAITDHGEEFIRYITYLNDTGWKLINK